MKKMYLLAFLMSFMVLCVNAQWRVYDADILPDATGTTDFDLTKTSSDNTGDNFEMAVMADADDASNNLLKLIQPDDTLADGSSAKFMVRSDIANNDGVFTLVYRVKGTGDNTTYDRVLDMQIRNGAASLRDELQIIPGDSTLNLSKGTELGVKVNADLNAWHVYRIVVNGASIKVFLDENETPVLDKTMDNSTSDNYFKFGDESSAVVGGYLDYIIIDTSGAFIPGTGTELPDSLEGPIIGEWRIYNADVLPEETGTTDFDLTKTSSDNTGDNFEMSVMTDPDNIANNLLKLIQPDDTLADGSSAKFMVRSDIANNNGIFTLVYRVKGTGDNTTYDRVLDMQIRNGAASVRDELQIIPGDSTLNLSKGTELSVKVDADLNDWHIFRIAVNGTSIKVYLDEDETPVLDKTMDNSTSDNYFKFGDESSAVVGGYLDYILIDTTGAYAPGENLKIPAPPTPPAIPVTAIDITGAADITTVGGTVQLGATVTPADADDITVTWSSSATAIATVSATGLVQAVSDGSADITATANDGSGVKGTATIVVSNQITTIPVASVAIDATSDTVKIEIGASQALTATVSPTDATDKTISWSSDAVAIATVDAATGEVTGVTAGTASITVTTTDGGKTDVIIVKVEDNSTAVTTAFADAQLSIYPNPASDLVHITNASSINNIEVFNASGQLVLTQTNNGSEIILNIAELESGVHIIRAYSSDNVYVTKFIKN